MSTAQPQTFAAAAPGKPAAPAAWLLSPALDLVFVANLAWPVVAIATAAFADTQALQAWGFLLAYFIIMPHRWLTLPLVFCDRERLAQRPLAYLGVLAAIVMLCSTVRLSLSSLAVLAAIDYAWNAWHFAAQHAGIARIYERLARPADASTGTLEKIVLRTFFLFVLLRLTGTFTPDDTSPWLMWTAAASRYASWLDYAILTMPAVLFFREMMLRPVAVSRCVYLGSVCSLYALLLVAIRANHSGLILGCAGAATLFHSVEYMAVVTWHVPKNRALSQSSMWRKLIGHWGITLLAFMAFFAVTTWFIPPEHRTTWAWINLNVSMLHYAYDGMIWKRPKKPANQPPPPLRGRVGGGG
ncbi:MAG: hypothetical protein HYS13_00200 [Planctomycetia bacterium]|nr:hypothetical protein [Planctomycetia bacterium]